MLFAQVNTKNYLCGDKLRVGMGVRVRVRLRVRVRIRSRVRCAVRVLVSLTFQSLQ